MEEDVRPARIGRRVAWVIVGLLGVALTVAAVRLRSLGYDLGFMIPERVYDVDVVHVVEGHGGGITLHTFLPLTDDRQRVLEESNRSEGFELQVSLDEGNRVARWHTDDLSGARVLSYRYRVVAQALRYEIAAEFLVGEWPTGGGANLEVTDAIETDAPEIVELAARLVPSDRSLLGFLRAAFDYVQGFGFQPICIRLARSPHESR